MSFSKSGVHTRLHSGWCVSRTATCVGLDAQSAKVQVALDVCVRLEAQSKYYPDKLMLQ